MNEMIIKVLGSISPYPKGNCNCPGFLVEYNNQKILLDCGNGITRLLNFPNDLNNLNIFITHYHKDHFGDIGAIQYASYTHHNLGKINKKIKIYLPEKDFRFEKQAIILNEESYADYRDINNKKKFYIGNLEVSFENNESHTIESYMVKLENEDFKVIYTSDIGNTNFDNLISFCENADLIICESSYLLKHNSNNDTHLTAYDAGLLARKSKAKKLLLNHFWPEEDKLLYLEEAKNNFENTEIADEGKKLILRIK